MKPGDKVIPTWEYRDDHPPMEVVTVASLPDGLGSAVTVRDDYGNLMIMLLRKLQPYETAPRRPT